MYPCHTRVDGKAGVLYDSDGNVCSTWRSFSDTTRYLMIAGIVLVSVALLGLGTLGVVRLIRRRNRRDSASHHMVPERPMTAMSSQGFPHHRQSKSVATPTRGHRNRDSSRRARSRSSSLDSNVNASPSPSPLRQAQYSRPFDGGYEEQDLGYGQSMREAGYGPVSLGAGEQYGGHPSAYGNREDMEYLRDMSRSGSMMNVGGVGKV